jgi:hypothetical protein
MTRGLVEGRDSTRAVNRRRWYHWYGFRLLVWLRRLGWPPNPDAKSHIVWLELLMQIQTRHHLAYVDQSAPSEYKAISNGLTSGFIVKHL